jgi:hypothetical protein
MLENLTRVLPFALACFLSLAPLFLLILWILMGYRMAAACFLFIIVWIIISLFIGIGFVCAISPIGRQEGALRLLFWTLIASIVVANFYHPFLERLILLAKQRSGQQGEFIISTANFLSYMFAFETRLCATFSVWSYGYVTWHRWSNGNILWCGIILILIIILARTSRAFHQVPLATLAKRH